MHLLQNIEVAFNNLKANKGRAILTMVIIAFGIVALVAILTALDVLIFSLSDNFSRLGSNSFEIEPSSQVIQTNDGGRIRKRGEPISFDQAMDFKQRYNFSATVSVRLWCTGNAAIKYKDEKTNPTMSVLGIDDNYLTNTKFELESGRNFSTVEINNGHARALIGSDIVSTLFNDNAESAVNQIISIGSAKYKVVGTLKSKGSTMNNRDDRSVFIPILNAKRYYGHSRTNYELTVGVNDPTQIEEAVSVATGVFRNVRKLRVSEENDFEITKSDGLIDIIKENTLYIRLGIIMIAIVTLIGAAIGLMNIMLVSVTERTKEIGIVKAVGATQKNILTQFLTEAIVICQLGGLMGIVGGIIIGFGVSALVGGKFIIPWNWMILAIIICLITGLASGLYPALKAARLDPIESLRYE